MLPHDEKKCKEKCILPCLLGSQDESVSTDLTSADESRISCFTYQGLVEHLQKRHRNNEQGSKYIDQVDDTHSGGLENGGTCTGNASTLCPFMYRYLMLYPNMFNSKWDAIRSVLKTPSQSLQC